MASLDVSKVSSSLKKKGFKEEREGKHINYYFHHNGKDTGIRTWISHGDKEIRDHLIACMVKQTKLDKAQFLDLVNCPMTEEQYIEILKKQKLI